MTTQLAHALLDGACGMPEGYAVIIKACLMMVVENAVISEVEVVPWSTDKSKLLVVVTLDFDGMPDEAEKVMVTSRFVGDWIAEIGWVDFGEVKVGATALYYRWCRSS